MGHLDSWLLLDLSSCFCLCHWVLQNQQFFRNGIRSRALFLYSKLTWSSLWANAEVKDVSVWLNPIAHHMSHMLVCLGTLAPSLQSHIEPSHAPRALGPAFLYPSTLPAEGHLLESSCALSLPFVRPILTPSLTLQSSLSLLFQSPGQLYFQRNLCSFCIHECFTFLYAIFPIIDNLNSLESLKLVNNFHIYSPF